MYKKYFKQILDILFSILLLSIFTPIIVLTIVLLFFANSGNVFFIQQRPGKNGKPFFIIKFKTMKDLFDINGLPLSDDKRLTKIGKIIRSTSIDELLQLINVLKGEMSLIGPRPLLMKYLSLYSKEQFRRHEVKPGITGWAQVNGRNSIDWNEKFRLDVEYVDNVNFLFDVRIFLKTILNVISSKNINSNSFETMKEFKG